MPSSIDLHGDGVRLRTTTASDRDALVAIRSTTEVRERWRGDDLGAEFDEDLAADDEHQLTIEEADGRVIGLIQFSEEQEPDYRHASIDIYLDRSVQRRGLGVESIRTLVRYLFEVRGHHRLTIDPAADNAPAIGCYAKAGFRPVGVMRQYERQADGTWADGLLMELLATDVTESERSS